MFSSLKQIPRPEAAAALLSLFVSVLLMGTKALAYFLTGSEAIFSDALESLVNVAASIVAIYSLAVAHSPADAEHPYGHGKIEFLSAGFEGGMILLAGAIVIFKTLESVVNARLTVTRLDWGILLTGLAMLVNAVVGLYLINLGKRRSSLTLEADGHHLLSDAITSVMALAALAVVHFVGWKWADPAAAFLMGAWLIRQGWRLLMRSGGGLMDRQDAGDERTLQGILDSHVGASGVPPRICSYHKLRHRHSGRYHWVDFHIMLPPEMSVREGHDIASTIENEIERALGEGDATAHIEACKEDRCPQCHT